jgi:hypothetical protein
MAKKKVSREEVDLISLSLGRVVITAARLEHELTMTIKHAMRLNEVQERALVRPMATNVKITLLNRLAKDYLAADDAKRVTEVTGNISKAADKRNDLTLYIAYTFILQAGSRSSHSPKALRA